MKANEISSNGSPHVFNISHSSRKALLVEGAEASLAPGLASERRLEDA
jgi:hypothetical protein